MTNCNSIHLIFFPCKLKNLPFLYQTCLRSTPNSTLSTLISLPYEYTVGKTQRVPPLPLQHTPPPITAEFNVLISVILLSLYIVLVITP